ncbi:MAG: GTP cyclohydrolase II [Ectothiorhodospiraceae bacterium]|nr:GTP cyclohydrolase II [Chromatiales bacterium]MCP5156520.1 GTP cyclohydrolase II [Ectothiorhodospiraceae bacterium]
MVSGLHVNEDDPGAIRVDRALVEIRRGRAVRVEAGAEAAADLLGIAVETGSDAALRGLAASDGARLVVSAERAQVLGLGAKAEVARALSLPGSIAPAVLRRLAGVDPRTEASPPPTVRDASPAERAALALAKLARLVPAMLVCEARAAAVALADPLAVGVDDVARYPDALATALHRVSEARVPLAGHADCRLVLYREGPGAGEHVAVLIGRPRPDAPVAVRMHSACLTGDLLGSLRCDCGEQLQRSVEEIAAAGGGVLLYLDQEGRGIGLANKLRAYALQDAGLDTLEADRHLGFRADERTYHVAAAMLRDLGVGRVALLTNNPEKILALRAEGLEVSSRMPLIAAENPHNARYLRTKRERAGHLHE